jgi:hypothetical protein
VGKGLDSEKIKKTLLDTRRYFEHAEIPYRGTVSLIVGLPHESVESIRQTQQWLIDHWQGQSFNAFPLSIPVNDNVDNSSLIGKNYKKYGYKKLVSEDENLHSLNERNVRPLLISSNEMLWANDHMNVVDAYNLTAEFVKLRQDYDFGGDCFFIACQNKLITLQERLLMHNTKLKNSADHNITWYINAKLNYKQQN